MKSKDSKTTRVLRAHYSGLVGGVAILCQQENEDISISSPQQGQGSRRGFLPWKPLEYNRRSKSEIQPTESYGGDVSKALWGAREEGLGS